MVLRCGDVPAAAQPSRQGWHVVGSESSDGGAHRRYRRTARSSRQAGSSTDFGSCMSRDRMSATRGSTSWQRQHRNVPTRPARACRRRAPQTTKISYTKANCRQTGDDGSVVDPEERDDTRPARRRGCGGLAAGPRPPVTGTGAPLRHLGHLTRRRVQGNVYKSGTNVARCRRYRKHAAAQFLNIGCGPSDSRVQVLNGYPHKQQSLAESSSVNARRNRAGAVDIGLAGPATPTRVGGAPLALRGARHRAPGLLRSSPFAEPFAWGKGLRRSCGTFVYCRFSWRPLW